MYHLLLLVLHLFAFEGPVRTPPPAVARRLATLVARLGDDEFAVRQEASAELRRTGFAAGLPAVPALLAAADARDPEVRHRVRVLLEASYWPAPTDKAWRGHFPRLHAVCGGKVFWRPVVEDYLPWSKQAAHGYQYKPYGHLPATGDRLDWCYARGAALLAKRGLAADDWDYGCHPLEERVQRDAARAWVYSLRRAGWSRRAVSLLLDCLCAVELHRDS